ncbi:murein biosynthesis integral membrane protein MurJ [Clostridium sp. Cult3]|uniref:murein biosynthesis integral membrane protein MurJ n=1 Tax=Clostridium sp. Cult3 TaxID=2079004 RepID=UPI001F009FAA|nr:murein biosynthesis integral membrane protein MurJ [Clostridium sp. Cult3]MCF6460412.1 murein biosynthesis integral membrane protein MurJ [Clostridium sp. Cult3]
MGSMKDKAVKSVWIIIIFGIASKILGFIKETLIASEIGCCFRTDAYFVAFAGATLLAEILGEGISTSMVPVLLKIEAKEGKEKKIDYVNNLLHITILASLILLVLGWLLSPAIINIMAKGFKGEEFYLTVKLMKIGLPIISLIMIRSVFVAYLQSNHGFKAGAKSWIYYNIVYIIYLIFFNQYGTYGLMVAGILASLSQLFSVIPASKNMGYRYEKILDFKDVYFKEMLIVMLPILLALSINRINIIVDKTIASTLSVGSISWLNYANDIIQLVLGIFVTAIVTVLFPIISQEYHGEDVESLKDTMKKGMRWILNIIVPATLILVLLSEPIVRLFFQRGAFGPEATYMTSKALTYYALGLGSMAFVLILTKIHYAMHDSLTPTLHAIFGVVVNLIFSIILSKYMGIAGIALATSISTTLVTILLITRLNGNMKVIDIHRNWKSLLKLFIRGAIMALVIWVSFYLLGDNSLGLVVSIGLGIGVYVGMG